MKVLIKADFEEALNCNIELDYEKKIEVVIDVAILDSLNPVPEDTVRFFVTTEPAGDYNELIKRNQNCYSYLLTTFEDLFQLHDSTLWLGCTPFVEPDQNIKKKFAVSSILGGRRGFPGHDLRFELYEKRSRIKVPFDFYLASRNRLPDWYYTGDYLLCPPEKKEKKIMFDCMFHVAIDSFKRDHYFSEKLIDPFLTKTVPIYWGAPNIHYYFNPDGIIQVNSVEDIIWVCNGLGEHHYTMMKDAIEDNYRLALRHNYQKRLEEALKGILL